MPARPRFRLPSRPPLLAVALLGALPGLAAAVDFGRLELRSSLGQPLRAEVGVSAEAGESLVAGCLRVAAPGPHELPTIDDARLDLRPASGGKRLSISTARPLTEPAAVLVIEVDCGAGRSRHELPVLPKPAAAAGGDWVVAAGESPELLARTLFPGQPAAQRRFVAALARANPAAGIDPANPARTLPAGGRLRWPDWRALAADAGKGVVPSKAMRAGDEPGDAVAPAAGQLQLSRELSAAPVVDDRTRETLRREYQLLDMLQRAMSGGLPLAGASAAAGEGGMASVAGSPAAAAPAPAQASLPPAAAATEASSIPPASAPSATPAASVAVAVPPAPPVSATAAAAEPPPASPQPPPAVAAPPSGPNVVPPPATAADEDAAGDPMLLAAAGLAVALLLLLLVVRRRRAAAQAEREEFQNAQTIVLERPLLAPAAGEPSVPPPTLTATPAIPQPPEENDVNPVMELAEIMLSFGRLQGAAQTLQEYIEANPKEALQPWMKLLDIYREGGMRSEFDTLAGKLHGNFNVEVQQWNGSSPPLPVDSVPRVMRLEELPHICEHITATWGTQECLDYLHQLLRDNRGGERIGFTLPVVQEILLLIDIMTNREKAA